MPCAGCGAITNRSGLAQVAAGVLACRRAEASRPAETTLIAQRPLDISTPSFPSGANSGRQDAFLHRSRDYRRYEFLDHSALVVQISHSLMTTILNANLMVASFRTGVVMPWCGCGVAYHTVKCAIEPGGQEGSI